MESNQPNKQQTNKQKPNPAQNRRVKQCGQAVNNEQCIPPKSTWPERHDVSLHMFLNRLRLYFITPEVIISNNNNSLPEQITATSASRARDSWPRPHHAPKPQTPPLLSDPRSTHTRARFHLHRLRRHFDVLGSPLLLARGAFFIRLHQHWGFNFAYLQNRDLNFGAKPAPAHLHTGKLERAQGTEAGH